ALRRDCRRLQCHLHASGLRRLGCAVRVRLQLPRLAFRGRHRGRDQRSGRAAAPPARRRDRRRNSGHRMIDYVINGLPLHVLLVHLVVIVVPLAALCLLLSAFWPAARRRLGIVTPLVALVGLVAVPFTTAAGEWLQARVGATPL